MGKKFKYLSVPNHWEHYWTKYPEGYTILEALLSWVKQVDDLIDQINIYHERLDWFEKDWEKHKQRLIELVQEIVNERIRELITRLEEEGKIEEAVNSLLVGVDNPIGGDMRKTAILKSDTELLPYFIDPSKEGDTSDATVNELYEQMDAHHIYALYDELVEQDHTTRHGYVWGYLDNGDPLKWYHFEPTMRYDIPNSVTGEPRFDAYHRYLGSKPLLFITSGVHGNEKTNIWALYLTIKDILQGKTALDRFIRRNFEIVLLPAVNPYGLKHNTRYNINNKDLNRLDESEGEVEVEFVKDVRNSFLNDINYRQGILFIDSHDFNVNNYSDKRILWIGTNDRPLRKTLIRVGGMVKNKLLNLYPELERGEDQKFFALGATGVGYGQTINAWNWDTRVTSFSLECPNDLNFLGVEGKYSLASARIGYIIVRDFITQTAVEHAGREAPSHIVGFQNALTTEDHDFLETLHNIPSGRTFITGVYDDSSNFAKYMPKNPATGKTYYGVFKATKSDASTTKSGIMEFTTTNYDYVRKFYASFNEDGFSDWFEIGRGVVHTFYGSMSLDGKTASITDVFNTLRVGEIAELFVASSSEGIRAELPSTIVTNYGHLKVIRTSENTGKVEFTTYSSGRNRLFINNFTDGQLQGWTEVMTESVT